MQPTESQDAAERRAALDRGHGRTPVIACAIEQAASEYRRPKLKITDVRTAEVRGHGYQVHVRVYTDQGIVGQGESTDAASGNVPIVHGYARMLIRQALSHHSNSNW